MAIKIAINGFGRIGRSLLRMLRTTRARDDIEIVLINDIAPLETCAYLFQYDSIFGPYPGTVNMAGSALMVDGKRTTFTHVSDISTLDLSDVDLVLECTGRADSRDVAERGLRAGAGAILISGPSAAAAITAVIGANEERSAGAKIVSNASCTTNALAPLLKLLDNAFGLETGHMTTIHCYTGSQPTVDGPRTTLERSRAAAMSMVPTSTSAGRLVDLVLPELAGRITARAVRVPTASVSAVDLMVTLRAAPSLEEVTAWLRSAAGGPLIGWVDQPLVSTDLRMRPESVIIAGPETSVAKGGLTRIFGWYDNEWGFSHRMLDMARVMVPQSATMV
ncbi:type I glyceraldehyde-3-phosphate dehydrogenase [Actibacterium sp. 188UL27-1]|uniref:type I glyceraldehyde-3-phosphate dehydrogenase n=1 Tax=Actibacterium sp. 188UL27-1 TaxID=2786961 RepID=UPI00195799F5|nr:glyceraldehyde 3-phosphate dehydrogenase NAD-binding domain-containing protein [Actibacterium sp. 188UL27-1]MBM7068379.1 aldehyde dehydrogenase [Actibacterium sp. 188UL27-1]